MHDQAIEKHSYQSYRKEFDKGFRVVLVAAECVMVVKVIVGKRPECKTDGRGQSRVYVSRLYQENQQRVLDSGPCNAYTGKFHKLIEQRTQGFVTPLISVHRTDVCLARLITPYPIAALILSHQFYTTIRPDRPMSIQLRHFSRHCAGGRFVPVRRPAIVHHQADASRQPWYHVLVPTLLRIYARVPMGLEHDDLENGGLVCSKQSVIRKRSGELVACRG